MRNHPDAVMIFAAGFGTRMGALTADRPKPLIEVAGKPLLDHALDLTPAISPRRIVVNTHFLSDQMQEYLTQKSDPKLHISYETEQILDTGGGLKQALPLLANEPETPEVTASVFTLNSDAVWRGENPLPALAAAWKPETMDALLMCVPIARTRGYLDGGNFDIHTDGRLTPGTGMVYSGAQIMKTDKLHTIDKSAFSLRDLWFEMADAGRLYGLTYSGLWADVGHPDGITAAEDMMAASHV